MTIGAPDDQYEKEADAIGERVVQMSSMFSAAGSNPNQVQTKPDLQKMGEEEEEMVQTKPDIQLKCVACQDEEEQVQMKSTGGESTASPDLASKLSAKRGGGQPLPADTQALMGHAIGADFSAVRVHTDSDAIQMNRQLSAHAFTHGRDVYFNAGKYEPGTTEGKRLLGHELGHVVQQGGGEKIIQRAENDTKVNAGNLLDSEDDINNYVNKILGEARTNSTNIGDRLNYIYSKLGKNTSLGRTAIEDWVNEKLDGSKIYQPKEETTKYSGVSNNVSMLGRGKIWKQPFFPILNPTIKVNGILIGSDKLGHFFQQGFEYFAIAYVEAKGKSAAEKYGQKTEAEWFGLETTGVYSNADLTANAKGMNFYSDFITNPNIVFDISSYIGKEWNEIFNPNVYSQEVGEVVWKNLMQRATNGYMTDINFDSLLLMPIKPLLQVNGNEIKGMLTYNSPKKQKGTIKIDIDGVINYNKQKDLAAIYGVNIILNWTSGTKSGTGTLESYGENKIAGLLFEKNNANTTNFFEIRILL